MFRSLNPSVIWIFGILFLVLNIIQTFLLRCDLSWNHLLNSMTIEKQESKWRISSLEEEYALEIKDRYLHPPFDLKYNFQRHGVNFERAIKGQYQQAVLVDDYLKQKKNGFYIEVGAYDGEELSNTVYFEIKRNWTGLLIEGSNVAFGALITKHRRAYSAHSCLSLKREKQQVTFLAANTLGGIVTHKVAKDLNDLRKEFYEGKSNVTCFPLHSFILAMGNPEVDYLSLDVEGAELAVLKTVPWRKVNINVLTVETAHSDKRKIIQFMNEQGYEVIKDIHNIDVMFAKKRNSD